MRLSSLFRIALLIAVAPTLYAQPYKVLHSFGTSSADVVSPTNPGIMAQSRGGYLFSGAGFGTFKITTGGRLTFLHSFNDVPGGLTLATDGQYYGATPNDGGYGTIFKMMQDGTVSTLYTFKGGADGMQPLAPPIESQAGDFYGTTRGDRSQSFGSVYKITKNGEFTLLHAFTGADGSGPEGPLVQGSDYYFYGTTVYGGTYNLGTIFRISSSGDFKVLFNFDGTYGSYPSAGLIQANDGNYYGVTAYSDAASLGFVVFKMTPPGYAVTILYHSSSRSEGEDALGGLVQAADGNLYGTAASAGSYGCGVLFRVTLAGDFTVLHTFTVSDGCNPGSTLVQHTNGVLYGMTYAAGSNGDGTFYSLDLGLKPFVTYLPTYGRAGALVQILGQGFTSGSQVFFNGKAAASPVVVYPTYLRVIVPSGATTGPITVTTDNGTLTSNKVLIVHPD
jgi:uncharacterized repeat protein (TIGR03803 family)